MLSQFCIRRPIFASVLSILIVIAGLVASSVLPLSQYPNIAPPSVNISTTYEGADAKTLARTIAAPIEDQLSGVEGLQYYTTSIRSNGDVRISCIFEVGTDPNEAMLEINNRVRSAERRLPETVRQNGVNVRKRSEESLLMIVLTSPDRSMNPTQMADYATVNMVDDLKRIPGVGDVSVFGNVQGAMRIWLNPDKMALLGVTVNDVKNAVNVQNEQYAAGRLGAAPTEDDQQLFYTITTRGQLLTPEEFGNITIRSDGADGIIRIKDIARVEVGKRSYDSYNQLDGAPSITIGVYLQTGANAMSTASLVKAELARLVEHFPEGRLEHAILDDTTVFISASLSEVVKTLVEASLLVLVVVYLFLQNWRATLIPMIAVPVSLIGTMIGLWAFDFTINTLTLFAMTLAIGIVVDDAIVVLENVERIMVAEGLSARAASKKAMKEVSGALVAIVLVLSSVFIPVAFLGGMAGELYRQFAITITISVILSGFVALTLTPALCALILKPKTCAAKGFFDHFNHALGWYTHLFQRWVGLVLHHRVISGLILLFVTAACWVMLQITPTSFVPREDQGIVRMSLTMPEGASLVRTEKVAETLREQMSEIEGVSSILTLTGFDTVANDVRQNAATFVLKLKHWDERENSANDVVGILNKMASQLGDGIAVSSTPAPIPGLGSAAGFSGYLQSRENDDPLVLQQVAELFISELQKSSILTSLRTTCLLYTSPSPRDA